MSHRDYVKALNDFVDTLYDRAVMLDMNMHDLAKAAGLHINTVVRLRDRETELPRFKTVWALASAVGLQVVFTALQLKRKAG